MSLATAVAASWERRAWSCGRRAASERASQPEEGSGQKLAGGKADRRAAGLARQAGSCSGPHRGSLRRPLAGAANTDERSYMQRVSVFE